MVSRRHQRTLALAVLAVSMAGVATTAAGLAGRLNPADVFGGETSPVETPVHDAQVPAGHAASPAHEESVLAVRPAAGASGSSMAAMAVGGVVVAAGAVAYGIRRRRARLITSSSSPISSTSSLPPPRMNGMLHLRPKAFVSLAAALIALAGLSAFAALRVLHFAQDVPSVEELPLPFGDAAGMGLQGAVVSRGVRSGLNLYEVTFASGEDEEMLQADNVYVVRVPKRVDRLTLQEAVLEPRRRMPTVDFYGYRYTSESADIERRNVKASVFTERFPGLFFASEAAMKNDAAYGGMLAAFAAGNDVTLMPTGAADGPMFEPGLYVFVINDEAGAVISLKRPILCGNGIVEEGEECDAGDGNSDTKPDACRTQCKKPVCGDGTVDAGEACDDGNSDDADACTATCEEGIPLPFGDSGAASRQVDVPRADNLPKTATEGKMLPPQAVAGGSCGNGVKDGAETCDDANRIDGDGCSTACSVEKGWLCMDADEGVSACVSCVDSDPENDDGKKGVVTAHFPGGMMQELEDQCAVDQLMQFGCEADTMLPTSPMETTCKNGCSDGACLQPAAVEMPKPGTPVSDAVFVRMLADMNADGNVDDKEALILTLDLVDALADPVTKGGKFDIDRNGSFDKEDMARILAAVDGLAN